MCFYIYDFMRSLLSPNVFVFFKYNIFLSVGKQCPNNIRQQTTGIICSNWQMVLLTDIFLLFYLRSNNVKKFIFCKKSNDVLGENTKNIDMPKLQICNCIHTKTNFFNRCNFTYVSLKFLCFYCLKTLLE